jgi:hypothetical protein
MSMTLDEARQLRQELEAIEATMKRIQALWHGQDFKKAFASEAFPDATNLEDLDQVVGNIRGNMEAIIGKADELPTADSLQS